MEKGRILSLKRQITSGKLGDVVQLLLDEGNGIPEELECEIHKELVAGRLLDSKTMGRLVILTRSKVLYQLSVPRSMMLSSADVLGNLLEAKIPDPEIEEKICERLVHDFETKNYGFMQFLLEKLRDHGSVQSLEPLELIEYDFYPKHETAKSLHSTAIDYKVDGFDVWAENKIREVDVFLGNLLKETIRKVRERNQISDDSWSVSQINKLQNEYPFQRAVGYMALAEGHVDRDLGAALNSVRKATEAVLKITINHEGILPDKPEPVDKMQLPTLMAVLMDKRHKRNPDKDIYNLLNAIRDATTIGSHDQGPETHLMYDRDTVLGTIANFKRVLIYFETYVDRSYARD